MDMNKNGKLYKDLVCRKFRHTETDKEYRIVQDGLPGNDFDKLLKGNRKGGERHE